ncbi:hypothetical protein VTK73DRAFT_7839 [Phialemonium thermophilum]|uniref:Protein kinase domain-containing protein n=1 Tax=Phialemonium thermophilum TaxID=223376 RepID=A0ABR3WCG8_9PEZI
MADTDLIGRLYVITKHLESSQAVMEANETRYVPPRRIKQPMVGRTESDPTPPESPSETVQDCFDGGCLELRFSHGPQTPYGFVFGSHPNCDVVLPHYTSSHHFALTFDEQGRLIVKDLGSLNGTEVTYNGQGRGKRRDFVWIVGGHSFLHNEKRILITLSRDFSLQIVAAYHNITSPEYIDHVKRFRLGAADADNLLGRLDLRSRLQTGVASGARALGSDAITLQEVLGEGSFGVVRRFWNVSTAAECAVKQPSENAIRMGRVSIHEWKQEARIMAQISHAHIVKLVSSDFTTQQPQLKFEYVPEGSLDNHPRLSVEEGRQMLRQCLSALAYLHGLTPPIVHRDIKPSNILVQYRRADSIYVKLGDFGLSKEGSDPTTFCGTRRYLAPEVCRAYRTRAGTCPRRSYTKAVDIWSLGVTVMECTYGLPSARVTKMPWCDRIVEKLEEDQKREPDDLKRFLLDTMLIVKPWGRKSAQYCYDHVPLLTGSAADGSLAPTGAPTSPQESRPVESQDAAEEQEHQDTVLARDTCRVAGTSQGLRLPAGDDSAEKRNFSADGPPSTRAASALSSRKRANEAELPSGRDTKRLAMDGSTLLPRSSDPSSPLGRGGFSLKAFTVQSAWGPGSSAVQTSAPRTVRGRVDRAASGARTSRVLPPSPRPSSASPSSASPYVSVPTVAKTTADVPADSEQELIAQIKREIG